ncbi:hypothetical protein NPIL_394641 [Nephila pilipes]|uniref:Uncharacterized protein n=1 Tax=Nephila pilipes TaxID=299642 RepID=A0A8X6UEW5_NEPPI|nr:hypothetical protein NPIL_394641 [Nephila pilipes]
MKALTQEKQFNTDSFNTKRQEISPSADFLRKIKARVMRTDQTAPGAITIFSEADENYLKKLAGVSGKNCKYYIFDKKYHNKILHSDKRDLRRFGNSSLQKLWLYRGTHLLLSQWVESFMSSLKKT